MQIYKENSGITRRQFIKGVGMLAAVAVFAGVFSRVASAATKSSDEYIARRAAGIYSIDERMAIRKSHENPEILQIYRDYLSPGRVEPLTEKSEHLLHTRYGEAASAGRQAA
jgi:hypothetical protein